MMPLKTVEIEGVKYVLAADYQSAMDRAIQGRLAEVSASKTAAEARVAELEPLQARVTELEGQLTSANDRYDSHMAMADAGVADPQARSILETQYSQMPADGRPDMATFLASAKSNPYLAPCFGAAGAGAAGAGAGAGAGAAGAGAGAAGAGAGAGAGAAGAGAGAGAGAAGAGAGAGAAGAGAGAGAAGAGAGAGAGAADPTKGLIQAPAAPGPLTLDSIYACTSTDELSALHTQVYGKGI